MNTSLVTVALTPEDQELIAFASTFLATAEAIRITTAEEAQAVVNQTRAIKECAKTVEEARKGHTDPLREQVSAYMDTFRPAVNVLAKAEQLLKGALATWDTEQRRRAAIEAEARRKAEQEERDRLAEEQRRAEDLLAQADQAAAAGDVAAAEALEEQATAVQAAAVYVPATVVIAPEKPKGSSTRMKWTCVVVDPSKVPAPFLMPNQKALDAYADSMKENAKLDGCEFASKPVISIR